MTSLGLQTKSTKSTMFTMHDISQLWLSFIAIYHCTGESKLKLNIPVFCWLDTAVLIDKGRQPLELYNVSILSNVNILCVLVGIYTYFRLSSLSKYVRFVREYSGVQQHCSKRVRKFVGRLIEVRKGLW